MSVSVMTDHIKIDARVVKVAKDSDRDKHPIGAVGTVRACMPVPAKMRELAAPNFPEVRYIYLVAFDGDGDAETFIIGPKIKEVTQ